MLEEKLRRFSQTSCYPFHMPGHKRNPDLDFPNPYSIDITEIEGFDNLHQSEGILKEEQEQAALTYGSRQCYFLVNGSTCGILAAISAVTKRGERILVARNCHKAVYHAIELRELAPVYMVPKFTRQGLQGQITAEQVKKELLIYPELRVVVLTSPTYDGILSDIGAIAEEVHKRDGILIVDEAHGAHFGFHPAFPENAVRLGADLVIMSVHKTLPSFTQTALLHICSPRVDRKAVEHFLSIYETSSPSYLLMAGIGRCIRMLQGDIVEKMERYRGLLEEFRQSTKDLRHIRILGAEDFDAEEAYAFDMGKLVISTAHTNWSGQMLKEALYLEYQLQMEMAGGDYVLAMTSICDRPEGFERLSKALHELDMRMEEKRALEEPPFLLVYQEKEVQTPIYEALEADRESVPLQEAAGCTSAAYVSLYPPGIPILIPGEAIPEYLPEAINDCRRMGLEVEGLLEQNRIEVVKSDRIVYNHNV